MSDPLDTDMAEWFGLEYKRHAHRKVVKAYRSSEEYKTAIAHRDALLHALVDAGVEAVELGEGQFARVVQKLPAASTAVTAHDIAANMVTGTRDEDMWCAAAEETLKSCANARTKAARAKKRAEKEASAQATQAMLASIPDIVPSVGDKRKRGDP